MFLLPSKSSLTNEQVFYINLPVGGTLLALLFAFFHLHTKAGMIFLQKIKRIDYIGNAFMIASTVSTLTYGSTRWPWSSARTLVPLILGLLGLVAFMIFENSRFVLEPATPVQK